MGEYCGVYRYVLLSKEKDHPGAEVWWWGSYGVYRYAWGRGGNGKGGGLIDRDLILFTHKQQPKHVDNYSSDPTGTTGTTALKQRHGNNGTGHQSGERGRVVW